MPAQAIPMSPIDQATNRFVDDHADGSEKTYSMFNHLVGLLSLVDAGIVLSAAATGIMWAIKKDETPYLDDHGREAFNFQLSLMIYFWAGSILSLGVLAIPLVIALGILRLIGCIRGAMAANRGEYYRYPMSIRFFAEPGADKAYACNKGVDEGPIA